MVAHACNPSTWKSEVKAHCEFEASLGYILSSRAPELHTETLSWKKKNLLNC